MQQVRKRYREGAAVAGSHYSEAVKTTTGVIAKAIAGEELYAQQMQVAIANRSRAKGLAKVSDSDWQNAAAGKGAQRIGPGMSAAVEKQATGFAPFASEIDATVNALPARTADPATNVTNRVIPIAVNLARKKRELLG